MSEPLVRTEGLAKTYRVGETEVRALAGVGVSIERGEFAAIMGPSGSGKTTFMNLLGCLDRPSAGECWLEGQAVSVLSDDALAALRNRRIGFVFQNFNLLARASALENVELPLVYAGVPARARRARAARMLARVGLADRLGHRPSQLSGGQQQRVAIARALVIEPALVLADEPTGALDTRTSLEIMALLQALNRDGLTVVMVTHEPEIARFARRWIRFRDGRIVEDVPNPEPAEAAGTLAAASAA